MTLDRSTEFEVTIALIKAPDDMSDAESAEILATMNAARDAAFNVLQSSLPALPLDVLSTISHLLALRSQLKALRPHGTRAEALIIRSQMLEAIDHLAVQFRWDQATTLPPVPATLAATIAATIKASEQLDMARRAAVEGSPAELSGAIDAFNTAFSALKTRFEKEFPHGAH
jgi:hypothetical protein